MARRGILLLLAVVTNAGASDSCSDGSCDVVEGVGVSMLQTSLEVNRGMEPPVAAAEPQASPADAAEAADASPEAAAKAPAAAQASPADPAKAAGGSAPKEHGSAPRQEPLADASDPSILDFSWKAGTILLAICAAIGVVLTTAFKNTLDNGGIPHHKDTSTHEDALADPDKMKNLLGKHVAGDKTSHGKVETQALAEFSEFSILMNRPWRKEPAESCFFGDPGEQADMEPNKEWLGGKCFPNGETRVGYPFAMTIALWKFVYNWKGGGWCFAMQIGRGVLLPLSTQIVGWIIGELQTGSVTRSKEGILASVPGTPRQILLYYVLMLIGAYILDARMHWSHFIEQPFAGPIRQVKIRMQRKLMALKGTAAKDWPAGRCLSVVERDAPAMFDSWDKLFEVLQAVSSLITTICIVGTQTKDITSALAYAPMILIVFVFAIYDLLNRKELLLDMALRKRMWITAESSMLSSGVRLSREGGNEAAVAEYSEDYWQSSFVVWYRTAHAFFTKLAASKACGLINHILLGSVIMVAGADVLSGRKTFSQFASTTLLVGIIDSMISQIRGHCVGIIMNSPSIEEVAEVFNMNEDFSK